MNNCASQCFIVLLESPYCFVFQWIQCDLRVFDMSVLGKCAVIMADPPWDIHMELPYGTMQDDEMRKLPVPALQDDGYIFLWVTGRYDGPCKSFLPIFIFLGYACQYFFKLSKLDKLLYSCKG